MSLLTALPAITPTLRSFRLGEWPQSTVKMRNGRTARWAQVSAPAGARMELTWENITYAQAELVMKVWDARYGIGSSIELSAATLAGMSTELAAFVNQPFAGTVWKFAGPPTIESVKNRRCTLSVPVVNKREVIVDVTGAGVNGAITFTLSAGGATGFSDYWNDVTALRSINYGFTEALTTPSGTFPGNNGHFGGVLLQDGRVFCVPHNSTTARIYDPVTNTLTTPSGTYPGNQAFYGGVLLQDGRVFCVPFNSNTARIYDPVTDTLTTPSGTYSTGSFANAFVGGVLLRDGRVYCLPHLSATARIYDPVTNTTTTPSGTFTGGAAQYFGGVLMQDGRVFCVPSSTGAGANNDAKIYDPVANTLVTAGGGNYGNGLANAVLLPDGRVFCVPRTRTTAVIYNPVTDTAATAGGTYPSGNSLNGGVLLPDGRVYCRPSGMSSAAGSSLNARIYNPATDTVAVAAGTFPDGFSFNGGVLMFDGRVYCVPSTNSTARIFGTARAEPLPANRVLNPYDNRY